jgi:hypothetical protein
MKGSDVFLVSNPFCELGMVKVAYPKRQQDISANLLKR